jgi:nicotinamide-nucleotide amidase
MQSSNHFNQLIKYLKNNQLTLASAESYTGGLFSSKITGISGASKVFNGAIVTYVTDSKVNVLNVRKETIADFGTVSSECALVMAQNVRQVFDSAIGISFTGVAGPDKQEGKEVGTCYIGVATKDKNEVFSFKFEGLSRKEIQDLSVEKACEIIMKLEK